MSFACIVSLVLFVPDSSIPDEIPNFVGREKACKSIEDHLTDSVTRLVNVWGPPGFGKTSAAIRVAHRLQKKNIPVYFASLRGMESKEDLVSKLLSMFVDNKQVGRISLSHFSIQCLQRVQNPFVLMLDNADDLLGSGDTKRNDQVLQFIEEILTHCKQIKLLLTTRESLDYLNQKLPMYSEKINVLDKISSEDLVRLLLPDASDDDCNFIVRECGNVPMSMRLMCSIIKEESISIDVLLQELNNSTLVEVLDHDYLPEGFRIKSVMNTSFKRLTGSERDAFVSLSVFPEWFGLEEAQAILNVKSEVQTKQIIRSLERKSLIDCGENFSHFTVHSLLRSFIQEETKNDQAVEAVFRNSQIQFYDYYISSCKVANEKFLKERYGDAFRDFVDRRSCIISSLLSGPRIDRVYSKVVELLSEAKSFLSVALHEEQTLLKRLYETAVEEAKTRGNLGDKQRLQSAIELHSAKGFFWLSRVQREGGNLKGAEKSAKAGSKIRKELLGQSPNRAVSFYHGDVAYDVIRYNDILVKAFQKGQNIAHPRLPDERIEMLHYYCNIVTKAEESSKKIFAKTTGKWKIYAASKTGKGYRKEHFCSFQEEVYKSFYLVGVREETAERFLQLARKQREEGNLTGALESLKVEIQLRQVLSPGHSKTAPVLFEQGEVHYAMGNNKSAVEAFQKAIDMCLNLQGYQISTAHRYFKLGTAQYEMQDLQGALNSLKKASNMRSHLLRNNTERAALTYYTLGKVQRDTGDLKEAMESLQSAAKIRLNLLGDHRDTALSYYTLGEVQRDTGDLKGAMESLQSAAKIRLNLLGDHRDTALSYYTLGEVQRDTGDLKEAMESFQCAANIRLNLLGDHRDTAQLGLVQRNMGDLQGALDSLQKAAHMQSNLLGDHEHTASSYHILGVVQRDMGDLKGALNSLQRATNMRLGVVGYNKDTASSFFELSIVQKKANDLKSALVSVEESLRLRRELLGDHPNTADSLYEQGAIHFAMGDFTSAVEALQKAAEMNFNLRRDHINTARSYLSLGIAQKEIQDHEGALDSLQKAVCMQSNLLGDHVHTAYSYQKLGLLQRNMGDLEGALDSLQKAVCMQLNLLGDHEHTASSYHILGLVQRGMGDLKGAINSLQRAANMRLSVVGDHEDTASSFFELGVVQKKAKDLKSALVSLKASSRLRKVLLGDFPNTADSLYELGILHCIMGECKLAFKALQEAADINFNFRKDHINTARNYHSLGIAQELMGDNEGALGSLQKAACMQSYLLGDHEDTASSYHELGVVQHGMGDLKGALKSLQKALDMRTHLFGDHGDTMSSLYELRAVQKKLSLGRSFFGKVFRRKNRHENNDKL